jgi:guanine deaminase
VLAHNLHPTDDELKRLAGADAAIAHCPTSNSALGGGLFPLQRHLAAACGSRWAPTWAPAPASAC